MGSPSSRVLRTGIGETGGAEIDGEHARIDYPAAGLDRTLAGAATGDQDVDSAGRAERMHAARGNFMRKYSSAVTGLSGSAGTIQRG